jgi:phosphate/sulfate permease
MDTLLKFRVPHTTDVIASLVLAPVMAIMTSYPPTLPQWVIQGFDFPIIRLGLLGVVLLLAFITPITAIVLGVGLAVLMEDILKLSRMSEEAFRTEQTEGFVLADTDGLDESVGNKVAEPFNVALEHIRRAELAIQSLAKPPRKLPV